MPRAFRPVCGSVAGHAVRVTAGLGARALLAGMAVATLPRRAAAHDLPRAHWLMWSSDAPEEAPVVLTNRGLLFPGSDHYRLRCNEAYGAGVAELTQARLSSMSELLLVSSSAARFSADQGCSWQAVQGLPPVTLGSLSQPAARDAELLLSTLDPDGESHVLASANAQAFATRYTHGPGELFTTLLVAPSNAQRVYASGARVNREESTFERLWARSDDGGARWTLTVVPTELVPFGVHPGDPDVVFAREPSDASATSFRVLRSDDGGLSFLTVVESVSSVTSFAATPDASRLWVGAGREGGLYESRDGGLAFQRVHPDIQEVHCLHERLGKLWLCGNRMPNVDGVWVSHDGAQSFDAALTFDEVRSPVACAGDAESVCVAPWHDWVLEIFGGKDPQDPPDAGAADAGAGLDAGTPTGAADAGHGSRADGGVAGPGKKNGAGCSLGARHEAPASLTVLSVFLAAFVRRAWRRGRALRRRAAPRFP